MAAPERAQPAHFPRRNIPTGGYSTSYSKVSENGNLEALAPIGFEFMKQALQTLPFDLDWGDEVKTDSRWVLRVWKS